MRVYVRSLVLFTLGLLLYYLFGIIQGFRSGIFNDGISLYLVSAYSAIPVCCGLLSVFCGLASPRFYHRGKLLHASDPEWTSVLRCFIFFMGISHAAAKLDMMSLSQLCWTSSCFAFGIWWIFDRSISGLLIGVIISLIGTGASIVLGDSQVKLIDPLLTSWLPCVFFSGCVTASLVGRQLAKSDPLESFKLKGE